MIENISTLSLIDKCRAVYLEKQEALPKGIFLKLPDSSSRLQFLENTLLAFAKHGYIGAKIGKVPDSCMLFPLTTKFGTTTRLPDVLLGYAYEETELIESLKKLCPFTNEKKYSWIWITE